ncbi:N/A [soil metagenome]
MISSDHIASFSEIGGRAENQDALGYKVFDESNGVFVVCDGVGGGPSGKLASIKICERIVQFYTNLYSLKKSFLNNNPSELFSSLAKETASNVSIKGGATTMALCIIENNKAVLIHAGDSRIYLIRNDKIQMVTKDHSMVQSMVDTGIITADEAHKHPMRNQILKAIVYGKELPAFEISDPVELQSGDSIFMTTDGVHGHYRDEELLPFFHNGSGESEIATAFKNQLIEFNGDNYSAIIIKYK